MSNSFKHFEGKIAMVMPKRGFGFVREVCPRCGAHPDCGKDAVRECRKCHVPLRDFFFHVTNVPNRHDREMIFNGGTHPYVEFSIDERRPDAYAFRVKLMQPEVKRA